MTAELMLNPDQVAALAPLLAVRASAVLVAGVHPDGSGWRLTVHSLPPERRDAIRAACVGELRLPKRRKHPIPEAPPPCAFPGPTP